MRTSSRDLIVVPESARRWTLAEAPISVRMTNSLTKRGMKSLGDLDGLSFRELRKVRGCGDGTVAEFRRLLQQLREGFFDRLLEITPAEAPVEMVQRIDAFCSRLNERDRDLLVSRLGGRSEPRTLVESGRKYRLTRERVRQLVNLRIAHFRRQGGPPLGVVLDRIVQRCQTHVSPLTPESMKLWLEADNVNHKYEEAFYVRFIAEICPRCPAWGDGRGDQRPTKRQSEIIAAVAKLIDTTSTPMGAREVYDRLRRQSDFAELPVNHFLHAVRCGHHIGIRFTAVDEMTLLPTVVDLKSCARHVLEEAARPMTPTEILDRALRIWGDRAVTNSSYRLARELKPQHGFFLFGRELYGLARHVRVSPSQWPKIRDDAHALVQEANRSVSTYEILNQQKFVWGADLTAYELAIILQGDPRFVSLGSCAFEMAEPRATERSREALAVA